MNVFVLISKVYGNETRLRTLGKQTQFLNPPNEWEEKGYREIREKSF